MVRQPVIPQEAIIESGEDDQKDEEGAYEPDRDKHKKVTFKGGGNSLEHNVTVIKIVM